MIAQIYSYPFQQAPLRRLILTRLAGISCAVLPDPHGDLTVYRLWLDPSYAVYVWTTITKISNELGGTRIGAAAFDPGLMES